MPVNVLNLPDSEVVDFRESDADRQMTERLVRWIGRQSLEYLFTEIA